MTLEEASGPPIEVWPDNLAAVNVFICLSTQWRTGMTGPTGLDYAAIPEVMRMSSLPRSEWPEVFECIRVMEDAALEQIRKNAKAKK